MLVGVFILAAYAILAILLIFMERKVCVAFQCRLGPMRVGPWGVFQVIADVLKMLIKEIFAVDKADKLLYTITPMLVLIGSVGAFSFMPWNKGATILDFNVGIFLMTVITVTVHDDGTWSYEQNTVMTVPNYDKPFEHTDFNTLHKVDEATPNPTALTEQQS